MSKVNKFFKSPIRFYRDAWRKRVERRTLVSTGGKTIYIVGFSTWKKYIRSYFPKDKLVFLPKDIEEGEFSSKYLAAIKSQQNTELWIWGLKAPDYLLRLIDKGGMNCRYVEDGFIRSVNLGATKAPPMSLCFDSRAPYFDARRESDLEHLLATYDFDADAELMARAQAGIELFLKHAVSKYNHAPLCPIDKVYGPKAGKRILVIGQVEDDASIRFGCDRPFTNNDLVRLAAQEHPNAQIIYKPHPDVLHGHRPMQSNPEEVAHLCMIIREDIALASALETIDHVYTTTSLAGFEALLRGVKVTTYGCPFYAGWGVTDDRQRCTRRNRRLTIEQIFAAAYLIYPYYFDPTTGKTLAFEDTLKAITASLSNPSPCAKSGNVLWRIVQQQQEIISISKRIELAKNAVFDCKEPSGAAAKSLITSLWNIDGPSESTVRIARDAARRFKSPRWSSELNNLIACIMAEISDGRGALKHLALAGKGDHRFRRSLALESLVYESGKLSVWGEHCYNTLRQTYQSEADLLALLKDRSNSICIVGNSPIEIGRKQGERIDSHDIVFRFNNFSVSDNYKIDYGEKTDIWVKASMHRDIWRRNPSEFKFIILSGPDRRFHGLDPYDIVDLVKNGGKLGFVPSRVYAAVSRELDYGPSAGLLLLYWLKELRGNFQDSNVSVFGFSLDDQVNRGSSHYFGSELRKQRYPHNWSAEAAMFHSIVGGNTSPNGRLDGEIE